jgi:hypothetical protein
MKSARSPVGSLYEAAAHQGAEQDHAMHAVLLAQMIGQTAGLCARLTGCQLLLAAPTNRNVPRHVVGRIG